jgi:hypothetical protein
MLGFRAFRFGKRLVSHQEEFAEAFPDGYHFEMSDGSTRVRRRGEADQLIVAEHASEAALA